MTSQVTIARVSHPSIAGRHALTWSRCAAAVVMKKKALKNPEVETNFLRDPEREREERELREKLKKEWLETQERIKRESTAPSPKNQGRSGKALTWLGSFCPYVSCRGDAGGDVQLLGRVGPSARNQGM